MKTGMKRCTALILVMVLAFSRPSVIWAANNNQMMSLGVNEPVDETTRLFYKLVENGDKQSIEPPEMSPDTGKSSMERALEEFASYEGGNTDSALWGDIKDGAKGYVKKTAKEEVTKIIGPGLDPVVDILAAFEQAASDMKSAVTYHSPQEHATFRVADTAIGYYVVVTNGFVNVVDAFGLSVCTVPLKLLVKVLQYGRDFIDQPEVVEALNSMNPWFMKILDWFFAIVEDQFSRGSRDGWGVPRATTDDITWQIRMSQLENCYKPNIYLYGEPGTELTVTFEEPELLTKTLPDYDGSWQVVLGENGCLTVDGADGYEYLFYESLTLAALMQQKEGFVISADTRAEQFEQILGAYGFNETEICDFVDFWTEKLEQGCDYVMYPQMTETVDGAMPITVGGAEPDSYYRIWFYFAEYNGQNPEEPVIDPVCHDGLTLIEWGGIVAGE